MPESVKDFIANLSTVKIILLMLFAMVFADMTFYYINSFIGRTTPPYPILYELFSLLKEIHIEPIR